MPRVNNQQNRTRSQRRLSSNERTPEGRGPRADERTDQISYL